MAPHRRELRSALARVVAAEQAHPLSAFFGDAAVSSSDGQHFPLGGQAEVLGAVNPHKGSGPAVSFYTWVSGRYAPFYTKVISVSEGEAAHVIDGLLYHGGDVDIAVHPGRRLGPRLRALPLAGLSVRAAYSQPGRSAAPYLRSGYHLADARTLHRRKRSTPRRRAAVSFSTYSALSPSSSATSFANAPAPVFPRRHLAADAVDGNPS